MLRSRGSAPLDFILVSVPMLLVTLSVIGFTFNGYAKNIAQDVAAETARYAALADEGVTSAKVRAVQGLSRMLPRSWEPGIQVTRVTSGATCLFQAEVTVKPLSFGLLLGVGTLPESARAACELQG